jgi:hypothetical protein
MLSSSEDKAMNRSGMKRSFAWARPVVIGAAHLALTGCVYAPAPYGYGGYYGPAYGYYGGYGYYGPNVDFFYGGGWDGGGHRWR